MDALAPIMPELKIFVPTGVAVIVLLYACGVLRSTAFANAPPRHVGLHIEDLCIGIGLLVMGWVLQSVMTATFFPSLGDTEAATSLEAPQYALLVMAGQASMLPLMAFILWRVTASRDGLCAFGLVSRKPIRHVLIGLLALVAALPVVLAANIVVVVTSTLWVEPPPAVAHEMLDVVKASRFRWATGALLLSATLVAPVLEEIYYRGLVQTVLLEVGGRGKRWSVVLVASTWFTLMHMSVVWQGLPILFVLSICLGWLYERTGNLWPGIVVHMGFNGLNFAQVASG